MIWYQENTVIKVTVESWFTDSIERQEIKMRSSSQKTPGHTQLQRRWNVSTSRLTPHDITLYEGRNLFQNVLETFILHPEHVPEQMSPHCGKKIIPVQTIPSPEWGSIVLNIHDDDSEEGAYLTETGLVFCLRLKSPSLEYITEVGPYRWHTHTLNVLHCVWIGERENTPRSFSPLPSVLDFETDRHF
jgi:hypothetical protein